MVKLGKVTVIYTGTGFPKELQGCKEGKYPFYKVGDISKNVLAGYKKLMLCDNYIEEDAVKKIKGKILPKDTVVFAKIGEAVKLNRRAITTKECLVDNNVMGIAPIKSFMDINYLYYYMSFVKLENLAEATTVPSVKKGMIEDLEIDLPTLDTQRIISNIISEVDDLILLINKQLDDLNVIVKSRFVEMFGELKSNSKKWVIEPFDYFATIDGNMTTDFVKYANYPHIGIDSIEKNSGILKGYKTVKEDGVKSGKYIFNEEHIIYSKIRPNLNKVALPDFEGLCSADAYPILVKKDVCNRIYLVYVMRSSYFLDYILAFSSRTNMPKVNRAQVKGFSMPLPPVQLQNQFASFVMQVDKSKLAIQQSLDELETLKKSLMQQYFG